MAGAGNRSGGMRRTSKGGLSKATGRGRDAKASFKAASQTARVMGIRAKAYGNA